MAELNYSVYLAAKAGDNLKLNELISNNGFIIDLKRYQDGNSPLHIAAIKGHVSTVAILLQAGAAIDFPNQDGHTALALADMNKHTMLVESLVKAGADATVLNHDTGKVSTDEELTSVTDINWQEEEDIAHEISDLLDKIDKDHIGQNIKDGFKKKLDVSTQKLAKLFEKQKMISVHENEAAEQSLEALLNENPQEERVGTPHKDSVVSVMLQKKAIQLKKQLEVSDMKARSATLQWINDKVKFKEEIETLKAEKTAMYNKMAVMERSIRLTEQLTRDRYMIRGNGEGDDEVSELDKMKAMLFESDKNLSEKTLQLAEVQQQYSTLRIENKECVEQIDILQNRVDELLRSEESLHEMNDRREKRQKEDAANISRLKDELEEANDAATKYNERIMDLERVIKEIKVENEAQVSHLKKNIHEMQGVITLLVEQKEEIQRECHDKIHFMTKELELVTAERNSIRVEKDQLMETLQIVAKVTQQLNHDIATHKGTVDKELRSQKHRAEDIQSNLYRLQSTVGKVLDEARNRAERVHKEFDAYRLNAEEQTKNFETEIRGLKYKVQSLQFQVENAENLQRAAVAAAIEEETAKRQLVIDDLNRAKIEIDELYEKIKELKIAQQSIQDQLWTIKAEKRILEEEIEKLQESNATLSKQAEDAALAGASAGAELENALAEISKLEAQIANLKEQLRQADDAAELSKTAANDLQEALDKANRLREEANNDLEETTAALLALQELVKKGNAPPSAANFQPRASFIALTKDKSMKIETPVVEVPKQEVLTVEVPKPEAKVEEKPETPASATVDKKKGRKKRLIEPDLPPVDIGMPDFTVAAIEHVDVVEEDQPIKLDIGLKKVEALVRRSVVTDNYYFSKEADGFTNDYPVNEDFMNDLIRAFNSMCVNACDIVEISTTKTPNRYELIEKLTNGIEDLIFKTAKDLVINLEKSKEDAINAYKIEQMKMEMEGGSGGGGGESGGGGHSIDSPAANTSNSSEIHSRSETPAISHKPHHVTVHVPVENAETVAKYEAQLEELKIAMQEVEEKFQIAQEELEYEQKNRAKLEELYHEQQAEIDKLTYKDHEKYIEAERIAAITSHEVCTDNELDKIVYDLKQEQLDKIAAATIDVEALKKAAEEGELLKLGDVKTENFERLKGKGFGPDFLVDLTIIEHHIRYDQEAARMNGGKTFNKMAMRSLEIQRDALQKELLQAHTLLDFMRYKHASEKYIVMLDTMSVFKTLVHDQDGGMFRDVVQLHLDVLNRIIDAGGGWKEALKLVNNLGDATVSTTDWPEFFRVRALEALRLKLIKEVEDKKARLENCFKIIHQKNTEEFENKKGNMGNNNFTSSNSDLLGVLQQLNKNTTRQSFVTPAAPNNSFFVPGANPERKTSMTIGGNLTIAESLKEAVAVVEETPAPPLSRGKVTNKSVSLNEEGPTTPERPPMLSRQKSIVEKRAPPGDGKLVRQQSMMKKKSRASFAPTNDSDDASTNSNNSNSITASIAAAVAASVSSDGPIETAEPSLGKKSRKGTMKSSFSQKHQNSSFTEGGKTVTHGPNSFSIASNQQSVMSALNAIAEAELNAKPATEEVKPERRPSLKRGLSTSAIPTVQKSAPLDSSLASVGEDDDDELGQTFVPKPLKRFKMQSMRKQGSFRGTGSNLLKGQSNAHLSAANESASQQNLLVRQNSSVYKLRNALKHVSHVTVDDDKPVEMDARMIDIVKTLHANCDKIVLCALYDEEKSDDLLALLCEGIEKWYTANYTEAQRLLEEALEYETTSNIVYDLLYILEEFPKHIPNEVNEIYEKMIFISDYCTKRHAEREEEMQRAIEAAEQALMQRMNPNLRLWSDHEPTKEEQMEQMKQLGLSSKIVEGINAVVNRLPINGQTPTAESNTSTSNNSVNSEKLPLFSAAVPAAGSGGGPHGRLQRANTFTASKAGQGLSKSVGNLMGPLQEFHTANNIQAPQGMSTQTNSNDSNASGALTIAVPKVAITPVAYTPTVQATQSPTVVTKHDIIKPTTYDCAVQTVGKINTNGVFIADPAPEEVIPAVIKSTGLLPPTIICAYVQEGEFELAPGILFASTKRLEASLAREKKTLKDYNGMPPCVRYCIRTNDAKYDKRLKLVPSYLKVPRIEGCDAVLFPPVYELQQGVSLLTNEKACNGINVELPHDVVVLQVLDNAELPRGLTMVELSPSLKVNPKLLDDMMPGHQLVQIMKGTEIILPVGTEVSRGVRVVALAEEMELPPNVCIVKRMNQSELPDWMEPLQPASSEADESLYIHLKSNEACCIVKKPEGIDFRLGMEIIRRPQGMPMPPYMTLVPLKEYPERLKLSDDLELVQLLPRFDFPPTCKISPTWCVFPRPLGMNIPPGVLIVYPDPLQLPAKPLPHFACPVWMPDVPYGVKLPALAQAIQLMHGSSEYALPEGAELAPGLTVVSLDRFLNTSSANITRPPTPNVLLVKRENHAPLPAMVERGNREDLPPGTLLSEGMEILRINVRFEVPTGVTLELGAKLGPCTQLAPGTILSRYLEVMQWPYAMNLNQGTELVRIPDNYNLPSEYQLVVSTDAVPLPTGCYIVKLPHSVVITPPRVLAGKITVGIESMVQDKSLPLPAGSIFASRESKKSSWPAEILPLPRSALHPRMLLALNKINSESSIGGGKKGSSVPSGMNIEAVRMVPYYSLPPGALIVEGVTVMPKPFWLNTPRFVELVHVSPLVATNLNLGKGVTKIQLRTDYCRSDESSGVPVKMSLPTNCILVQLSEAFQPFSWGPYLPGVEAVNLPKGQVFLPPGHYLIERPLRKKGEELPPGFRIGLAHEFKALNLPLLAPNVEVMHIVPTYQLPPGISVINASVICKNSFNTSPIINSGRFDMNWVPQICAGDYLASGCSAIKHPTCNSAFNDYVANDNSIKKDPHVFVHLDSAGYALPSNFAYHLKSNEIVSAVFGAQYCDTIKYIMVANGLPSPNDRLKKDYGTARYIEAQQKRQLQLANDGEGLRINNIENLHIEVCRVLTSLDKASNAEDHLVNQFLTRLSVFRLNDETRHEDYKILRNSKKFVMLDAGIQKIRDTCDSLDSANAWLKKQVENMMRERNTAIEQKAITDKKCAELTEQVLYDGELRNIVHKLNEKLIEKTKEFNDLSTSRHELAERQRNQIEVLTTQLADWNSGKINPELENDLKKSQEFLKVEEKKVAEASLTPAMMQAIEKQIHTLNQSNLSHLNGITHLFNATLMQLVEKFNLMMAANPPVPTNTAFMLLETSADGTGSPGRQRGLSNDSLAAMLADSHDTDEVDKMITNAVASRVRSMDLARKPQSMTLTALTQRHPVSGSSMDDEEFLSFSKSMEVGQPGRKKLGAPQDLLSSNSVNNLFTRMKKQPPIIPIHSPERHSQVLAKLPTLMDKVGEDTNVSPSIIIGEPSVDLNAGSSFVTNTILKPSEEFKSQRHDAILKEDHSKVLNHLKTELSTVTDTVMTETNKDYSMLLAESDTLVNSVLNQLKQPEPKVEEILTKANEDVKQIQEKHLQMVKILDSHLDSVSNKVINYFKYIHDIERMKYVKALQNLEHEIKYLNDSINTCESHNELIQCFLAEAKSKNHEYSQNTLEGMRERIWILEHKLEKRIGRDIQPAVSVVQAHVEKIQEIMEIERSLKFTALTLKQRASQEEAAIREAQQDIINKSDREIEEMKKEKKAIHHYTSALRNKAKHYKERADRVHNEIDECVADIMEAVQAYDRAVQAVIPTKLQSKLLKIGSHYFENLSVGGNKYHVPASLLRPLSPMSQNSFSDPAQVGLSQAMINQAFSAPSSQQITFDDQSTVGGASVVSAKSIKAANAAIAQKTLDEASTPLQGNRAKLGSIGTMPAVTNHNHLALKVSGTSSAKTGHNNRPSLR